MNGEAKPGPAASVRQRLRERLTSGAMIVAPGIYDAFGARFVEQVGFEAVYMTGNGVSASLLGRPDVGLVDLTLIASHAHRVAACVDIPLICDADTGYGNAVNVRRTVEEFEAAGVAAIHLEDQVAPKRCGHLPGSRPVVSMAEHVGKVEAAVAARRDLISSSSRAPMPRRATDSTRRSAVPGPVARPAPTWFSSN
ncbi:MAG: isocitrate lyase/PEP mutase family protein [Burkholderiales bacterium]|nr:isocitrate lyase/PEP mutase family protein [Burkholderiales bacterium]